jgi:hypothetical protein
VNRDRGPGPLLRGRLRFDISGDGEIELSVTKSVIRASRMRPRLFT